MLLIRLGFSCVNALRTIRISVFVFPSATDMYADKQDGSLSLYVKGTRCQMLLVPFANNNNYLHVGVEAVKTG